MGKEDPRHPQPDDLPEHERTGDEPNPSGNAPTGKERKRSPLERPPDRAATSIASTSPAIR